MARIKDGDTVLYKGIQRTVEEADHTDDTVLLEGIEDRWIPFSEVIRLPGQGDDEEDEDEKEED